MATRKRCAIAAGVLTAALWCGVPPGPAVSAPRQAGPQTTIYLPVVAQPRAGSLLELGQLGGRLTAMAIHGRHLFVAVGPRLVVLDIADPYAPRQIGASPELPGVTADLAFDGDILWVTFVGGLLAALDIADPAHPAVISTRQIGPPWTSAGAAPIAMRGRVALVGLKATLWAVDVADPRNPRPLSPPVALPGAASAMALAAERLHVAYWAGDQAPRGLVVFDVAAPGEPRAVGRLDLGPGELGPCDLDGAGGLVVAVDGRSALFVDASDPAQPVLVLGAGMDRRFYPNAPWLALPAAVIRDVAFAGREAWFAGEAPDGVWRVDLADLDRPRLRAERLGFSATEIRLGDGVLAGASADGVALLDLGQPDGPVPSGVFAIVGVARRVWLDGSRAYVGQGSGASARLNVVDIAQPDRPRRLAGLPVNAGGVRHAAEGWLWEATSQLVDGVRRPELVLWDVRDPNRPERRPPVLFPPAVGSLGTGVATGGRLFLATTLLEPPDGVRRPALAWIHAGDPAMSTGVIALSDDAKGGTGEPSVLAAHAGRLFAASDRSIWAVDGADSGLPRELARFDLEPGGDALAWDLFATGEHVILITGQGTRVFEVGASGAPREITVALLPEPRFRGYGQGHGTMAGGLVYLPLEDGLQVWDFTWPLSPARVRSRAPGAGDVAVAGGLVAVAGGVDGLRLLGWR